MKSDENFTWLVTGKVDKYQSRREIQFCAMFFLDNLRIANVMETDLRQKNLQQTKNV